MVHKAGEFWPARGSFLRAVGSSLVLSLLATLVLGQVAQADEASAAESSASEASVDDDFWQKIGRRRAECGVNSLYIFLRLHGLDVSYDQVSQTFPGDVFGRSLLDLKEAASQFDVDSSVRRCSVADLRKLQLPVISYANASTLWTERETKAIGHFYVVTFADEQWIQYVDGTTGVTHRVPHHFFAKGVSGHVLVASPPSKAWDAVLNGLATGSLGVLLVGLFVVLRRASKPPRDAKIQAKTLPLLLAPLLVGMGSSSTISAATPETQQVEADAGDQIWRQASSDGVNTLFLFLRCHGVDVQYGDLEQEVKALGRPPSMLDLMELSKAHGVNAEIRRTQLEGEARSELPAITLIAEPRTNLKSFVLLFQARADEVSYLGGGYARMSHFRSDEFRRIWSGVVLTRAADQSGTHPVWAYTLPGALMVVLYVMAKWLTRTQNTIESREPA